LPEVRCRRCVAGGALPDARKPDARKPDAHKPDARKPDARKGRLYIVPDGRKGRLACAVFPGVV